VPWGVEGWKTGNRKKEKRKKIKIKALRHIGTK
jgi:hypothetical protein